MRNRRINKLTKRGIAFAMAILLTASTTIFSSPLQAWAEEDNSVVLTIGKDPEVEVALAVGNTKVNYANFENDLRAELINRGIKNENISFVEVDANASAGKDSFEWWEYDHTTGNSIPIDNANHKYVFGCNSLTDQGDNEYNKKERHIVTTENGTKMTFYGYGVSAYKDFNFLPNEQSTKKTIEFTVTEGEAHDAMDGYGFLVNSSITGDMLTSNTNAQVINGYLIFFQYNGSTSQSIKIFKLDNVSTYNLHQGQFYFQSLSSTGSSVDVGNGKVTLLSTASTSFSNLKYRKFKIEVMPDYVKLWYVGGTGSGTLNNTLTDANLVRWNGVSGDNTKYPLTEYYDTINGQEVFRGGYGVLSSYKSHWCEMLTTFELANLKMEAEYVRSLTETIRESNWSADKHSFIVNLNGAKIEDFSSSYTTAEIINRLLDDDIAYIGWCSSTNKAASQVFVDGVGNGSGLVSINDAATNTYQKQVAAIAKLIVDKLNMSMSSDEVYTFLDTEKFTFKPTGALLNDGNWSVGYNVDSFEACKDSVSTYQNLANAPFSVSGYYEVYYNGRTNVPKAKIRIHQAPVAILSATIDESGTDKVIVVTNKSYDPEFCQDVSMATASEEDGIASSLIEYRNVAAANPTWSETAPEAIGADETWLVRLTVTDTDGATATNIVQVATGSEEETVAPYGSFRVSANQYIKGIDSNVIITDQSYMLDGGVGFTTNYEITQGTTTKASFSIPAGETYTYALSNLSEGSYAISMTATANGKTSPKVTRTIKVVQGYTVTYSVGEGTGAPSTQYKIKDQNLVLSSIAPSRTGYTFQGWQVGGSQTTYQPGDTYTANSNAALVAVWAKNMTYDAQNKVKTYDANAYGIDISVTDPADGYTIKYGTSAGNCTQDALTYQAPGTYKIYFEIKKSGYQTITGFRMLEIKKTELVSAVLEDKAVVYSGAPVSMNAPTLTGIANGEAPAGTVTCTYYTDELLTKMTSALDGADGEGRAPSKAGTYYVKASVAADAYYESAVTNVAKLAITDVTQEIAEIPTIEDVTLDDKDDVEKVLEKINELLDEENEKNLTSEQKQELIEKKQQIENIIKKVEEIKESIDDTTEEFETLPDEENITVESKQSVIDQLEEVNRILEEDGENLTEEQKQQLEETKSKLEALLEKVEEMEEKVDKTTEDINNTPTLSEIKTDGIDDVKEQIKKIEEILSKDDSNLTEEQKQVLRENKEKLENLKNRIETIKDDIMDVESDFDTLPDEDSITSDRKNDVDIQIAEIERILNNYPGNLTQEQKDKLIETKGRLETLKQQLEETAEKLETITEATESLPTKENATSEDTASINAQIAALEEFMETETNHLTEEELDDLSEQIETLKYAVSRIKEVEKSIATVDAVYVTIPEIKKLKEQDRSAVEATLEQVNRLLETPDNLTEEQKAELEKQKGLIERKLTFLDAFKDEGILATEVSLGETPEEAVTKLKDVAIDGLGDVFQTSVFRENPAAVNAIAGGGSATLVMAITKPKSDVNVNALSNMMEKERRDQYVFFDIDVNLHVKTADDQNFVYSVTDTKDLVLVSFPLTGDAVNKTGYQVYRSHKETEEASPIFEALKQLTKSQLEAQESEGFYVENNIVYVLSHKFSTYAVGYVTPVNKVAITGVTGALRKNATMQLEAIIDPIDATIKDVVWTSSNPKVATVDANGVVTGLKKGTAVITATTADGVTTQITITVANRVSASGAPLTGDGGAVFAWMTLLLVGCAVVLVITRRKNLN